jgi:hypothetical protein
MEIFVAHDNNMVALLYFFDLLNSSCLENNYFKNKKDECIEIPSFASSLILEIWSNNGEDKEIFLVYENQVQKKISLNYFN